MSGIFKRVLFTVFILVLVFGSCYSAIAATTIGFLADGEESAGDGGTTMVADMNKLISGKPTGWGNIDVVNWLGDIGYSITGSATTSVQFSLNKYAQSQLSNIPLFLVNGNHEAESASDILTLRAYYSGLPNWNLSQMPNNFSSTTNYAYDVGDVRVIVVNQYAATSSDAVNVTGRIYEGVFNWVKNEIKSTTKEHIIVLGHEPTYPVPSRVSGNHIGDALDADPTNRDRFVNLLASFGNVNHFVGHTHVADLYELKDFSTSEGDARNVVTTTDGGIWEYDGGAFGTQANGDGVTGDDAWGTVGYYRANSANWGDYTITQLQGTGSPDWAATSTETVTIDDLDRHVLVNTWEYAGTGTSSNGLFDMKYYVDYTAAVGANPDWSSNNSGQWWEPAFDPDAAGWTGGELGVGFKTGGAAPAWMNKPIDPLGGLSTTTNQVYSIMQRVDFPATSTDSYTTLTLGLDDDDGVIAWLNGTLIFNNTTTALTPPTTGDGSEYFDKLQTGTANNWAGSTSTPTFTYTDISQYQDLLVDGQNTLVIWNVNGGNTNSSDLGVAVRLTMTDPFDATAPVISAVASSTTGTTATITWTTDDLSDSQVEYGATTAYGATSTVSTDVTSHGVTITGLSLGTVYHFRVKSTNTSDVSSYSGDYTFTTSSQNDPVTVYLREGVSGYTGSDDIHIMQQSPTTNANASTSLLMDGDAPYSRALLRWDLSEGTSGIPATASVTAAYLVYRVNNITANQYDVYRALQPWTESATWNTYDGSTGWGTVGAHATSTDFNDTILGTLGAHSGTGVGTSTLNADGIQVVQDWIDGVNTNNGFLITRRASTDGLQFESNSSATTTARPALAISYIDTAEDTTAPIISSIASTTGSNYATITWNTNELATSTVDYGTTSSYGSASSSAAYNTSHSITIRGLDPSTLYHYKITVWDAANNQATSTDLTFLTAEQDVTAPIISNVASTTGAITATVTWTTNELANSKVVYGLSTGNYTNEVTGGSYVTSHSRNITGLDDETLYYYRVVSADQSGNIATSSEYTFLTAPIPAWWNSSWLRRVKISLNNSGNAANLTNFPVRVALNGSRVNYGHFAAGGNDIRFIDADGSTELSYEIENWNTSGTSNIWVKVPQIDASSNTDYIYMYYQNGSASAGEAPSSVWDSSYVSVHHFTESSGTYLDSTSGNHDSDAEVGVTREAVSGGIGNGLTLVGTSSYVTIPDSDNYDVSSYTIEAFIRQVDAGTAITTGTGGLLSVFPVISKGMAEAESVAADVTFIMGVNSTTSIGADFENDRNSGGTSQNSPVANSDLISSSTWYHIANRFDNAADTMRIYLDGVQDGEITTTYNPANGGTHKLGIGVGTKAAGVISGGGGFDGQIDEVRISNVARSAEWLAATHMSVKDTYNTYDTAEAYPDNTRPVISNLASSTTGTSATITWTTDELATSYVDYGLTSSYSASSSVNSTASTSHSVTISGLDTDTLYHFRAVAIDIASNLASTTDNTFRTTLTSIATSTFQEGVSGYSGMTDASTNSSLPTTNAGTDVLNKADGDNPYQSVLMKWDLSSIPTDATVEAVYIGYNVTNESQHQYEAYQLNRNWVESEVTWDIYSTGNNWTTHGASSSPDRGTDVIAAFGTGVGGVTGAATTTLTTEGISLVQGWVDGSIANYGMVILDFTSATNSLQWTSSEGTTASQRPVLMVVYSQGPDVTDPIISNVASSTNATTATITWTTNEASDSVVNYGVSSYNLASSSASDVTSHSITLTGLTSNTEYHFQVTSTDDAGNLATSSDYTFTTADSNPPVISHVASSTSDVTANVSWITNNFATSKVSYGTVSGTYTTSTTSASLTKSHSLTLTSLSASTQYFYVVVSTDALGLTSTSSEYSLLTTATGGGGDSPIAQYTGGIVVYSDGTTGTPKYKVFDNTNGFGAEQSAASVGASAIEWIRVAASPTADEWIIATRDAADVLMAQVCTGVSGGISCGSPTTITSTAGTHGLRNFDVAYENSSGHALLVYGTNTADELRKIEWTGSWGSDAAITTTRTTGTVEWVELTSRAASDQIAIGYSDSNDDVSAYRWSGTAVGNEATAAITAVAPAGDVRKFDISFEGSSGDMVIMAPTTGAGTTAFGHMTSAGTWAIFANTAPDVLTAFMDLQEPNPSDDEVGAISHGTVVGTNLAEGYMTDGTTPTSVTTGLSDGNNGDSNVQTFTAGTNAQLAAVSYHSSTYYSVGVFSAAAATDDISWWTANSGGTVSADETVNTRTRGASRFMDLFDFPSLDKVMLLTTDANSDLWVDTWNGAAPSGTAWVDVTSGGALETSVGTITTDAADFAFRLAPVPVTTLGDGTDGSATSTPPGGSAVELDRFSLVTSTGSDTVTGMTVTLSPANAYTNVATIDVQTTQGVSKCSLTPTSNSILLTGCAIAVTTTPTEYKIMVTPKSHANMPATPGVSYAITGTVTSITATNSRAGTDTDSATATIDNAAPGSVTSATASVSGSNVNFAWTNPSDSDFTTAGTVLVLKSTSTAVTSAPVEGTTYSVGNSVGSSTVACVVTGTPPATSCQDSGFTSNTAYYYKIFTRDSNGNYNVGTLPFGTPVTPIVSSSAPTIESASNQMFEVGGGTQSFGTITITESESPSITAANDLRIGLATSTLNATWHTGATTLSFGGTAAAKASNPVSYTNGGTVVVIPIGNDLAAGETLTISGLSVANVGAALAPTTGMARVYTGGASDAASDASDTRTIAVKGTLSRSNHAGGQVENMFTSGSITDTAIYAFQLVPGSESSTINSMVLKLSSVKGVSAGDITNARLYLDHNASGTFNAGDVQVGGSGSVSISNQTGTITFSSSFTATTTKNYILVADVASIGNGDEITVSFNGSQSSTGVTSAGSITSTGTASNARHYRGGSRGGNGGGQPSSEQAAPAGAGNQSGGGSGGGNEGGGGSSGTTTPQGGGGSSGGGEAYIPRKHVLIAAASLLLNLFGKPVFADF